MPPSNDAILTYVLKDFDYSKQYHQPFHRSLRGIYDLYRCIYTGKPLPTKNKVMLPLMLAAVWSDIAFKAQTSLGAYPAVEFRSDDPSQVLALKRIDAIVNGQLRDAKAFEKLIDFLGSAEIYGTGILRLGWRAEKHQRIRRRQLMGYEFQQPYEATIFDGPDMDVVDLLDYFPAPGYKPIDECPSITHRSFSNIDDILEAQSGDFPLFDEAAVDELLKSGGIQGQAVSEQYERATTWRSLSQYEARRQAPNGRQVEILDHWCRVPGDFAEDGCRERVITIANRRVVLRNRPTPFESPRMSKPFFKYCPMPDVHDHFGIGKGEVTAKMSAVANKLVSARVDAIELFLGPAFIAAENAGLDTNNLVLWPGRIIRTSLPDVSDKNIRPLSPDLRAYQLVFDELAAISRYIQQATGVSEDTIQGLQGGSRTTAREFLGRMEMGKNRLSLEVMLFETQVLEPVADCFKDMDAQWLDFPRVVQRLGPSAIVDEDTGEALPNTPEWMSLNDINVDSKAHALGRSQLLGKQMQFQNLTAGGQFMTAHPVGMLTTNWNAFFSRYWKALDVNPQEMMLGKISQTNALAQMLQGGGGEPGGESPMGSGGGLGLEGLDPSRLNLQSSSNVAPVQ